MIHYPELKYRRRLIGSQRKGRFSRIALSKDYRKKFRILQGPGRKDARTPENFNRLNSGKAKIVQGLIFQLKNLNFH